MPGLYSRESHSPAADRHGVLWQQGKVQLDAEFNELVRIVDRQRRLRMFDLVGPCGVPRVEPEGFRIRFNTAGELAIGRGRAYVDGILAECHGTGALEVDAWGELRGVDPVPLDEQPYARPPRLTLPPAGLGPHLLYLDVWEREITWVEDGSVLEKAVGVDTTARLQTAWAVRCLPNLDDSEIHCPSDWSAVPEWVEATEPSGARLSTAGVGATDPADPCFLSPAGGFRGRDNRLYRVEVHNDGRAGGRITFKWSRDNAAVAARVMAIATPTGTRPRVQVDIVGRDAELRFNALDWVELTDDDREIAGLPGVMAKVHHVEDATNTIELYGPLSDTIDTARNPRIRRWDQKQDVTANGVIEVGTTLPWTYELEDGVEITFEAMDAPPRVADFWTFAARTIDGSVEELDDAPPRGIRHHYCRLAIVRGDDIEDCRTLFPPEPCDCGCECTVCVTPESHADGSLTLQMAVDKVTPDGGKICLARGLYLLDDTLRIHRTRGVQLCGRGSSTVILHAGPGPAIDVTTCLDVTIERLALATATSGLPDLLGTVGRATSAARTRYAGKAPEIGILLRNTFQTTIERCFIAQAAPFFAFALAGSADGAAKRRVGATAIALAGIVADTRIRDNTILSEVGVGILAVGRKGTGTLRPIEEEESAEFAYTDMRVPSEMRAADKRRAEATIADAPEMLAPHGTVSVLPRYLVTLRLLIEDNLMACLLAGVELVRIGVSLRTTALVIHAGETRVAGNSIYGGVLAGIALSGIVPSALLGGGGSSLEPSAEFTPSESLSGDGLASESFAATAISFAPLLIAALLGSRLEVRGNLCVVLGYGVVMGCDGGHVTDNELMGLPIDIYHGVAMEAAPLTRVLRGVEVNGNSVHGFGGHGIAVYGAFDGGSMSGNLVSDCHWGGIVMIAGSAADGLTVEANDVRRIGRAAGEGENPVGIRLMQARNATVTTNEIDLVGDRAGAASTVSGIELLFCDSVRLLANDVREIGPRGDFGGVASGIAVTPDFDRVDVAENAVRPPDGDGRQDWVALRVGNQRSLGLLGSTAVTRRARSASTAGASEYGVRIYTVEGAPGVFIRVDDRIIPLEPGRSLLAVHGNHFEASGRAPAVLVETPGNCNLNDNRCLLLVESGAPTVYLRCNGSGIVSSNHVEARGGQALLLQLNGPATVLGNVTAGPVELNGNPLGNPWLPLNAIT